MRRRQKKKRLGFFKKAVLVLNCIVAFFLLLTYLASVVNPSSFWPLAFFGLAYPILLVINGLFLLYWLISKPAYSLISAVSIIVGWKFLFSTIGFRGSTAIEVPKSSNDMIRVMTWNVHEFKQFNSRTEKSTKDQMLDIIRREQPDILCLQEYYSKRRGEYDVKKALNEILNAGHYYISEDFSNPWELRGMAIFSKFRIVNSGSVKFPDSTSAKEALFADLEVDKQRLRVYNVHLQSYNFKPEDYEFIKNVKEINTDVESSKRVGGRLKRAFIKRSQQVQILKEHLSGCRYPYIIAGDFNDTPASFSVNELSENMLNAFREKGSGFGITYNGDFPNFQIDYILTSENFEVMSYRTIRKKLSDHYPVRSDLILK